MSVETPAVIRVGDHVRWTDPEMDLNVIWEVTRETGESFYLRCDIEQGGMTRIQRRRAPREDCVLVAHQISLTAAPLPQAGGSL